MGATPECRKATPAARVLRCDLAQRASPVGEFASGEGFDHCPVLYRIRLYSVRIPKRIELSPHASMKELERRYRRARDPVERSHLQIVWLLSEGRTTEEVCRVTGYTAPAGCAK
jgi:hypothetical protein